MGCVKVLAAVMIAVAASWYYVIQPRENGLDEVRQLSVRQGANLDGKNIIVTGGHGGIGLETVRQLATWKTNIWSLARNSSRARCEEAINEVRKASGNPNIYCNTMDLSSLASVADFAKRWKTKGLPLHILVNNAGVLGLPYTESEDGYELVMATNHLGHFLLANLLMDNLKQAGNARVVTVASIMHIFADIMFDDLSGKESWYNPNGTVSSFLGSWISYSQSKTANILFSVALNKRMQGFGTANSLHPGSIATNISRHYIGELTDSWLLKAFLKNVQQGAATTTYVATSPELEGIGGKYFDDSQDAIIKLPHALDEKNAERLWHLSEHMVAKFLPPAQENAQ